MEKEVTAQELYDALYMEAVSRARAKGQPIPNADEEVEIFKVLVKGAREAIANGDAPPDFMDELAEVRPQIAREKENAQRLESRERALREGTILDIEDLLK